MHKFLPIIFVLVLGLVFFYPPFKQQAAYKLKLTSDTTPSCINTDQLSSATGQFDDSAALAVYDNNQVDYPKTSLMANSNTGQSDILGAYDSSGKEKWIEVSLSTQTLKAWDGDALVKQYPISSGLFYPTPPGTYSIYSKYRYIRMMGGDSAIGTYYDLPNVPDTMFFYQGYALHGAYWHNNFGHPMSHGCVNEPLNEAHWLFEWAGPQIFPDQNTARATADNPGSRVVIHE